MKITRSLRHFGKADDGREKFNYINGVFWSPFYSLSPARSEFALEVRTRGGEHRFSFGAQRSLRMRIIVGLASLVLEFVLTGCAASPENISPTAQGQRHVVDRQGAPERVVRLSGVK